MSEAGAAVPVPNYYASGVVPRPATVDDIKHINDIAKAVYGERYCQPEATYQYINNILLNPNMLMLVTQKAFGCATVNNVFWEPEAIGYQVFLAALPNQEHEGLRVVEHLMAWAKKRGAKNFLLNSDMDRDFSALAKRLKMPYEEVTSWKVQL